MANYKVFETFYVEHQNAMGAMSWVLENCGYNHDNVTFDIEQFYHPLPWSGRYICAEWIEVRKQWKVEVCDVEHAA